MPRQSKYNKEEKDNVKSYQYKAAIYIRLSVEDGDKEESNSITCLLYTSPSPRDA